MYIHLQDYSAEKIAIIIGQSEETDTPLCVEEKQYNAISFLWLLQKLLEHYLKLP